MTTIDKYQFVKLKLPRLIAEDLIDNVKHKPYTHEQFYKYQEEQIKHNNQCNLLYAFVDEKKKIHGFLWAEVNPLDHSLFVNTFSIKKELWGKGEAMHKVKEFLAHLVQNMGFTRVYWQTTNEKFYKKLGFKRAKNIVMEYVSDENAA